MTLLSCSSVAPLNGGVEPRRARSELVALLDPGTLVVDPVQVVGWVLDLEHVGPSIDACANLRILYGS